jgi:hypothetical protein
MMVYIHRGLRWKVKAVFIFYFIYPFSIMTNAAKEAPDAWYGNVPQPRVHY